MKKLNFGIINRFVLFGGGKFLLYSIEKLIRSGYDVLVFSAKRLLEESIEGKTLKSYLKEKNIVFFKSIDINKDKKVADHLTDKTIGLSLGAPWIFKEDFIKRFDGKLINMHGTRLPQDRGGGNYSWFVLSQNRLGFCLIHQVDAGIDTGDIIKYKEFVYPASCKIPKDYADYHYQQNIVFFNEFLEELKQGKDFTLISQPEYLSTYWPRLNTYRHAFVNWDWKLKEIEIFINAFDEPYCGASTFLDGQRVFLKECCSDVIDGSFHQFQTGLVYRKSKGMIFIAAHEGTLIVKKVLNENGKNIIDKIKLGERFFTPIKYLEEAKSFKAIYTPEGLKEG